MTGQYQVIPEDSWVSIREFRTRRAHKVFATNGDVLTYCNRWLKRGRVFVVGTSFVGRNCLLCEKAASA